MNLSTQELDKMRSVDIGTICKDSLVDASNITLDNSLSHEERAARMLDQLKNPYCYRYGDMVIKLEFTDNGPSLQDLLAGYLVRQKSGL